MGAARFLAADLAAGAAGIDDATAPEAVRRRLRAVVSDVLATAVAAAGRSDVAALRDSLLFGTGPCTVIGSTATADPVTAALLNAAPVAAEQLQDGHREARGHPGSHVVAAVLAAAEAVAASGRQTLSAVLAGYEVGVVVGKAAQGTPPGVHDIATWGTIGAAAGVAHLLAGGDPGVVAAAIDLAAAAPVLPDAATVFQGATGQHVFLGLGAQLGVVWGQAAAAGLRPIEGTLERHFLVHAGAAADRAALRCPVDSAGTWREWSILTGYLKRHPTCAHLHGVNDAVEDLVGLRAFAADDIARVEVRTYAAAAGFADPAPANDLAARFSIPWTVAVALHAGGLEGGALARVGDPRVGGLARRVSVRHDPELDRGYPDGRPAVVVVRLHDGRTFEAAAARPRGDGLAALDDLTVRDKPRRLLASRLGAEGAQAVLAAVDRLADDGLGPLSAALRVPW